LMWESQKYPDLIKQVYYTNANNDNAKQVADMEDMLTKGVDAIILAAIGDGLCPAIKEAKEAGVPVIILERGVNCPDAEDWVTYIDVNVPDISTATAEWVCKQLNYEGNVVLMLTYAGMPITKQHEDGVKAVLAKYPGIKLLAQENADVSMAKGKTIMEAWLRAYPKIDGVICWTGTEAQGAIEAAKEANRFNDIKVWSAKSEQGYLVEIKAGMNGCGYYAYADCTIDALHAAIKILRGEAVPKVWRLPVQLITPENIDNYIIPGAPKTWHPSQIPAADMQKWLDLAAKQ